MPNSINFVQVAQPYHTIQAEQAKRHLLSAKHEIDAALAALEAKSSETAYEVLSRLMAGYSDEERQALADIEF